MTSILTLCNNRKVLLVAALLCAELFLGLSVSAGQGIIAIGGLAIGFVLILLLINPRVGYYAFILSLGLMGVSLSAFNLPHVPGAQTLNVHQVVIFFVFISTLLCMLGNRTGFQRSPLDFFVIILFVWACTTVLWTPDPKSSLIAALRFFVAIVCFFIPLQLITHQRHLKGLIIVWILVGIFGALLALFLPHGIQYAWFAGGKTWTKDVLGRAEALAGHANTLATQLSIGIFLTLGLLYSSKSRLMKYLYVLSIILMSIALVLTFSRGWLISFFIGIFVFFAFTKNLMKFFAAILLSVTTVVLLLTVSEDIRTMAFKRFLKTETPQEALQLSSPQSLETLTPRFEFWQLGFRFFQDSYFLGIGMGAFATKAGQIDPALASRQLHSLFFSVFFELGVIGFLIFSLMLISLSKILWTFGQKLTGIPEEKMFFAWCSAFIVYLVNTFIRVQLGDVTFWSFLALGILIMKYGFPRPAGQYTEGAIS
jgi:O-antigen ligase